MMSIRDKTFQISSSSQGNKFNPKITLTKDELNDGCMIGLDSWVDTLCMGKHAHVREFIEGQTVSASGFTNSLPSLNEIPIAHCSLAYDHHDGTTTILGVNHALYMGEHMDHCLLCPNQCEDNGIQVDLRPKFYYPNSPTASTLSCTEQNLEIPLMHKGPLPYFNIRRPTALELKIM